MNFARHVRTHPGPWWLAAALAVTLFVYWPGLSGGWLFDDYPNIVENPGLHIHDISVTSLTRAALSSPSSIFKRPLASLTFAMNYLAGGLDPFGWKLVNVLIHLLNGVLVYLLTRIVLSWVGPFRTLHPGHAMPAAGRDVNDPDRQRHGAIAAVLVAAAWMLLPINLTAVLYVVQRMESLANVFVLLGLIGYVRGRTRMLAADAGAHPERAGLLLCAASLVLATAIGLTAKETAVMLPFYAFLMEWIVFRFRRRAGEARDGRILLLFALVLLLPMLAGLAFMLPQVLSPASWAARDFTLSTRLLSEARIVVDYIVWTLVPLPHWLSFYHDDVRVSTGLLHPWTTLTSLLLLAALSVSVFVLRRRQPLIALGIALFLGCQLLTGTILPLELVYEHRNYFASYGLMLALVPWFAAPARWRWASLRRAVLGLALLTWATLTASTAYAWGDSLRLARTLAERAPDSPRAQYSLGRSYILASHYDPDSPYTPRVYAPLERAARLPDSSILPQQALIFFNARMHRPIEAGWWDSMIASLQRRTPGVQDESSLAALAKCAREKLCPLPQARMVEAFDAAVSHPDTSARLWASYGDYAWNVLGDTGKGLALTERAVAAAPRVSAYHITLARMQIELGKLDAAEKQVQALEKLNIGGTLNGSIEQLQERIRRARCDQGDCSPDSLPSTSGTSPMP